MISVVIPAFNDEQTIAGTITFLKDNAYTRLLHEIIVVDGGSLDNTVREAEKAGAKVIFSVTNNRSAMMNIGGDYASGEILLFVAPGSCPSKNYCNEIVRARLRGHDAGTFSLASELNFFQRLILSLGKSAIRFTTLGCQNVFASKALFTKSGGFNESIKLFEDCELVTRLQRFSKFKMLTDPGTESASISKSGVAKSGHFWLARFMYEMGCPQKSVVNVLKALSPGRRRGHAVVSSAPAAQLAK